MPFDGTDFTGRQLMLTKLADVRRLLDTEDKWCKKHFRMWDGRYCILGALMSARAKSLLYDLILASIHDVTRGRYRTVVQFNDSPVTQHRLIVAVLDRARYRILVGQIPPAVTYQASLLRKIAGAFRFRET